MITLTNKQARRFLLKKHGLLGAHRFTGKRGVPEFIRQAGCIQFDPVDVCGKNPELVLQSRVKGFTKRMLYDLLYKDRALFDYFDKQLSILPIEDWPYFGRARQWHREYGYNRAETGAVAGQVKQAIRERGPLSSADLELTEKIHWPWGKTKLSRAALESLYFQGDLVVHHKKGTVKTYDLAEHHIPKELLTAPEPLPDGFAHLKWRVLRRVGAAGLLWDKPSDALLGVGGLKAGERAKIFSSLLDEGKILPVTAEGVNVPLYVLSSDRELLDTVDKPARARCELLAPLDNLLWDRKLIKALFGFGYTWEIYTPEEKRRYGHYVLPLLYGDRFAGRVEAVNDRKGKTLLIKNIWYEDSFRQTDKFRMALDGCFERFARFNECERIELSGGNL